MKTLGNLANKESKIMSNIEVQERIYSNQYLSFFLGNELYGINIADVIEIIGIQEITSIPEQPSYVEGVINLRGRIISVIDVRARFGKEKVKYDERTCIIVIDRADMYVGFIVDRVSEVSSINSTEISDAPKDSLKSKGAYIQGISHSENTMMVLIDGKLLLDDESARALANIEEL